MNKLDIRFEEVDLRNIEESEINAQEMSDKDFNRLVRNIKRDGVLTSAPLLMDQNDKEKKLCISGHHRIKAAIKANIFTTWCLIINEVDESTRIRIQLAHNDIHGTPNESILKLLEVKLNEIDIELINKTNEDINSNINKEINIDIPNFRYVNICLLDQSREDFVNMIMTLDKNNDDINYLLEKEEYSDIRDLLTIAHKNGFKSPGQAFRKFLDIVIENKDQI